ncbi:hypothetical protein [Devosia sp. 63-57]|uniref:hypothetical protein n=1 Tax=Devosia sp. 63-57 TaxID=1895751 RepID=UPI00086C4490|nr:hypothetical protein [Devosia sp. 63-57]ODT50466.1 MAG: hypothetical protein ABS74_02800 [Pelagibacterium sp. SCN 63-126]ODU88546.1 MAG: hypothetical protein ABT14_02400 [Pelagibacterium sp. SCN 63-17]OJX45583.1 MAG: hypothetical protein BGO80_07245 [Devosia sp. 63-57]
MVAISSTPNFAYMNYASTYGAAVTSTSSNTASVAKSHQESTSASAAATNVTLSDAARAALADRSFTDVITDARGKLAKLLEEAGRTSPIKNQQLAVDLSSLDNRELYAISSDKSFTEDERAAAGLEMQRRLEAALAGPAAIARVIGDYTGLYKAAAAHLDGLGPEEKASADWKAGRDAVTEGLKQLQTRPGNLPSAGEHDPVSIYLKLADSGGTGAGQSMENLSSNARTTLDRLYADAKAAGRVPSFSRSSSSAQFIDLSNFSSRSLSSMVLDTDGRFSNEEVRAAQTALRQKSSATMMAGLQNATKSGDPTAFSQNVIAAFSSLSPEERQAAGWSDKMYQAALDSYSTTSKLMQMINSPAAAPMAASQASWSRASLLPST